MPAKSSSPEIPLPRSWPSRVKSAVLHAISLGQFTLAYTRGWAAIREARKHPWVLSTTRHVSQGGVSLLDERWDAGSRVLSGKSSVAVGDPRVLTVHLPDGFRLQGLRVDAETGECANQKETATMETVPSATKTVEWKMTFLQ